MSALKPDIIFKYCLDGEIHKSFNPPSNLEELRKDIISIFGDRLPKDYAIKYFDADQDLITISSEAEYLSMMRYDRPRTVSKQSIKIFILPIQKTSGNTNSTDNSKDKDSSPEKINSPRNSDGSFEVVEDSSQSIIAGHISEISLSFGEEKERQEKGSPKDIKIVIPEYVLAGQNLNETEEQRQEASRSVKEDSYESDVEGEMSADRSFSLRPEEEEAQISDKEDSISSHNVTIERLEARVAKLKKELNFSRSESQNSLRLEPPQVSENDEEREDNQQENSEASIQLMLRNFAIKKEKVMMKKVEPAVRFEDSFNSREIDSGALREQQLKKQRIREELIEKIQSARERMRELIYKDFPDRNNIHPLVNRCQMINNYLPSDDSMEKEHQDMLSFGHQDDWKNWLEEKENISPARNVYMKTFPKQEHEKRVTFAPEVNFENHCYRALDAESHGPSELLEASSCSIENPRMLLRRRSWDLDPCETTSKEYHKSFNYSCENSADQHRRYESELSCSIQTPEERYPENSMDHQRSNEMSYSLQSPDDRLQAHRYYSIPQDQNSVQTPQSENNEWWRPQYRELRGLFKKQERPVGQNFDHFEHNRHKRRPSIELGSAYSGSSVKSVSVRNLLEIPDSPYRANRQASNTNKLSSFGVFEEVHRTCEAIDRYLNLRDYTIKSSKSASEEIVRSPVGKDYAYQVLTGMRNSVHDNRERGVVCKTVYIENAGTKPWRRCLVKPVGPVIGRPIELISVGVGEIIMVELEIYGCYAPGAYTSQWRLIHENANGMVELIGEPFNVEFIIDGRMGEVVGDLESDNDRSLTNWREIDNNEEGNELQEGSEWTEDRQNPCEEADGYGSDAVLVKYQKYREEIAKVWEIRRWFPDDNLEGIISFVNDRNEMTADEAVIAYRTARMDMEHDEIYGFY